MTLRGSEVATTPEYSNERLFAIIEHQGLRLDWFATQLGQEVRGEPFNHSYVSKLRSGDRQITPAIANAAARILRVPVDFLIVSDEPAEVTS